MALREPAWRVSARELEGSFEEEREGGERSAGYVLSPFGARMNRVLIAGTLVPPEPIGRGEPQTFWRSRLSDPTGAVAVTAGSFQPRAMAQLRSVRDPQPALVVGKVHLYRGRDGVAYVSVRAEGVRSVSESEERAVLADIVRQTLDRLDLIERLEKEPATREEELRADGIPSGWIRAAREALKRYPQVDRTAFRRELTSAVRRVRGESGPVASGSPPPPSVTVTRAPAPRAAVAPPSAAERAEESVFLELLDEIAEVSVDGYADLREVFSRLGAQGLVAERAETVLNRLEDEGVVVEPIVGKLRRA
ncbi:MAG: hypothetical protein ACREDE_07485 [Thermoplasmata archaeon]